MAIEKTQDALSRAFFALADPTRRAMLARLATGEATVSELMEPFALRQPTISKHLKVLEEAGLIEQSRDAQRRPRRLAAVALDDVADWIETFRRQWTGRLDQLEAHLFASNRKER
jgi:DNA-binding transcriptional ArsR family regulator